MLLALGLLFVAGRSCVQWVAAGAIRGLPPSVDAAVGKAGAQSMRAEYGRRGEPAPARQDRVQRVFTELASALTAEEAATLSGPRVTLLVDDQVNAFALPGGEVFVLTGLLDRVGDDDAMLRGVLAHELGHAVRRHGVKALARKAATSLALGWLLGDADEMTASLVAGASELDRLSYSRDMETEADAFAVALLARTGHDPEGLARFLESLERAPVPELLSTHPDSGQRAAEIRARMPDSGGD